MSDRPKILVVDDEPDICDILLFNLESEGFAPDSACSAEEALEKDLATYDLLLLDVMMPGLSGFQLAEQVKANPQTSGIPIIFITAKSEENDLLKGFHIGADDYVFKPFSVKEVTARVKAVLNRSRGSVKSSLFKHQGLVLDADSKNTTVDGMPIALTRTEFDLLWWLISHKNHVFSRQELLEQVWPKDVVVSDRTVDVNITRMRKKIGPYSSCVVAKPGFGYCFEG